MNSPDDIRAILKRLARVQIYGDAAAYISETADPAVIRSWSDELIAAQYGGTTVQHVYPESHLYPR